MGQPQSISYHQVPNDIPQIERNVLTQSPQRQRHFSTYTIDEHYSLFWLDEYADEFSLDNEFTKNILFNFNPRCWTFYTKSNDFITAIQSGRYRNTKILLVVSGSLAEQVLPDIQMIVPIVIIFCTNYNKHIKLKSREYCNVVDVCTDYETLKTIIQRELPSIKLHLNENTPLKSLKSLVSTTILDSEDSLSNDNNSDSSSVIIGNQTCFSYILIVNLLGRMPQTTRAKDIWLNKCREYYRGNEKELKKINDFSKEYKIEDAIEWYIKDTFVYQLVNRALRTDDIILWYIFRYYIVDLCEQMKIVHRRQKYSRNLTLYRGQRMSITELESTRELLRTNSLFCTTAFFSTTTDMKVAEVFAGITDTSDEEDLQMNSASSNPILNNDGFASVIFEITVDSVNLQTGTFVDIDQYLIDKNHERRDEFEYLFIIGSIFKITKLENDSLNSRLWRIYMETTNDGSDMVQHQLDLLEKKYKNVKMNLLFGRYLLDMNYLAKAESYFQMLLRELKSSNNEQYYREDLALVNSSLGELHLRATNYNKAYEYLTAAYIIQSENRTANNLFTSDISFGNYYKTIGSPLRAYTYYKEALRKMNENVERNRININIVNINIASIHAIHGDYCESRKLCLEAGNSLRQIQSTYPLYSEMIICQGIIGDNYFKEKKYEEAGTYYRNAFNMCKQYFCLGDKQMVHCIRSLTEFYRKKYNDGDQHAIRFCQKQLELHQQHLSENHPSVAHLLMKLGDVKQDVSYYEKAVGILRRNDFLEYLPIAQCYKFMGDYYLKNEINRNVREARVNYCRTRQIYEQIYPEDHQCIVEIRDSINSIVQTSA